MVFFIIWNQSPTCLEAKPGGGVPRRGIIGTAEGCSVSNGWVIDRSGECALLRRLFLYLYAIAPLESADMLFSARYLDAADIWQEKKTALFRRVNTHRTLTERPIHQNNVLGRIVPEHDEAKRRSRGADITPGSSASDVSGSAHCRCCFGDSSGPILWVSDNSCTQFHQQLKGEWPMTAHASTALITGGTSGIGRAV